MHNFPHFLKKVHASTPGRLDDVTEVYRPLLAEWLIEMTLYLGWTKKSRGSRLPDIVGDDDFIALTGIEPPPEWDEENDSDPAQGKNRKRTDVSLGRQLKKRLEELRKSSLDGDLPLFANIQQLGRLLGLCDAEKAVLTYAVAMENFQTLRGAVSSRCERVSNQRLFQLIAVLTGHDEADVRGALRDDAPLILTGIVRVDPRVCDLEDKLDLMGGLGGILLAPHEREEDLVDRFLKRAGSPTIGLDAFPHLAGDIDALRDYLANAMAAKEEGVNVLFYGPPGTGKTEMAKAIAAALKVDLYEIAFADEDGDPIRGEARLRAYNLCQRILNRGSRGLLMFDEIEDVFPSRGFALWFGAGEGSAGKFSGKAWINRTLERNGTPAIWVTNDPDIDPAYLRRFDYSVKFPIPPKKVRAAIARHHLGRFRPSDVWIDAVADNEQISPAQYERAAKMARIAAPDAPEKALKLVEQALERSAMLLGQKTVPRSRRHTAYDLAFLNTDVDPSRLVAALRQRSRGTFCFYGPAGTGKSELARHIADEIGKPLLLRRASDLFDMWVGSTEKNIAEMFREARLQDALLVLDEADSFLGDRREAQRSWEVTQVNELLTQMESFDGIFICTTNLMDRLDLASLRRFAFKVKFDYLTSDQRWELFCRELVRLGGDGEGAGEWETPLRRLEGLTPGDFAVAARQFHLLDVAATAAELYAVLYKECESKGAVRRPIGF